MTIRVGESGGAGLIMPATSFLAANMRMKDDNSNAEVSTASNFWTSIGIDHTEKNWDTDTLSAAANTTEQTIVDITSEGVLTHVVCPVLSATGVITVRITTDGLEKTFVSPTLTGTDTRFCVGHFFAFLPQTLTTQPNGYGGISDYGWKDNPFGTISIPTQAIEVKIGMVFRTDLKVTIQGSVNITGTAEELKACAVYTTYIPVGL